jgi:hypothetical protein
VAGPSRIPLEQMASVFIMVSETLVLSKCRALHRPRMGLRVSNTSESNDNPPFSNQAEVTISEGHFLVQTNHLPGEERTYPTSPAWSVVVRACIPNPVPSASHGGASSQSVSGGVPEEDLTDDDAEGETDAEYEQGESA